MRDMNPQSQ
jgi:hypothetical protein